MMAHVRNTRHLVVVAIPLDSRAQPSSERAMQNQHCLLEWVWAPSSHQDPSTFTPSFRVFYPDGTSEAHPGMNAEVASFMSQLGTQGYRAATCVNAANWILWTLVR